MRKVQKPVSIERANKHMNELVIGGIVCMFVYGLLLPTDWQQRFSLLAQPIIWAADTVPSIAKMSAVSSMPELIKGFFGVGVYVVPLFGVLMILFCGALGARVRYAFSRPDRSFWKTFTFIYLFGCPALLCCLCMYYIHPMPPDNTTESYTWGNRIFFRMLHNQFDLAFYGSIVTIGFGVFVWMLTVALFGPILLLIRGDINGDNDPE